jgi:hypothetical protein
MPSRRKHFRLQTLAGQMIVLTAVMLLLYAVVASLAVWLQRTGTLGIAAAMAAVCYGAAALALLGDGYFAARRLPAVGLYWAMAIRTGVPLIALMLMKLAGGPFAEFAAVCYLITFYFGALVVQVALSYLANNRSPTAAPSDPSK